MCEVVVSTCSTDVTNSVEIDRSKNIQYQLRWDKANQAGYYHYTGTHFHLLSLLLMRRCKLALLIRRLMHLLIALNKFMVRLFRLYTASSIFVPTVKKGFLKFWWDEKFSLLKKASVKSDKLWKASGKPRNGPIFTNRQSCRLLYRKRLRDCKHLKTTCYTNDLHDALMQKMVICFGNVGDASLTIKVPVLR